MRKKARKPMVVHGEALKMLKREKRRLRLQTLADVVDVKLGLNTPTHTLHLTPSNSEVN